MLTVIRYIHQNPLKAGMSQNIDEYRWSSQQEYIKNTSMVDTQLILSMFSDIREEAIQRYKEFMKEIGSEKCLEIKSLKRLNDREALETIKQQLCIESVGELRMLKKEKRDAVLRKLKKIDGLSIRQIARITGFSVNIVAKA